MRDLDRRLRDDARAWRDEIDRPSAAGPVRLAQRRPSVLRRWLGPGLAAAAVLAVVAVGVVWGGGEHGPQQTSGTAVTGPGASGALSDTTPEHVLATPPLSVEVILPTTTARPGDVLTAQVRITNTSDQPVPVPGACNGLVQVGLVSDRVAFAAGWTERGCSPTMLIEPGTMSVDVEVRASYSYCSEEPSGSDPQCLTENGGRTMPKLPAGQYQTKVELNLSMDLVQPIEPITVTLTN